MPSSNQNSYPRVSANDAVAILFTSLKQVFKRIYYWIRPNIWCALLSVTILLAPAAKAGLYESISDGLRDPGESLVKPLPGFRRGFRSNIWRALALSVINLLILAMILMAILFWTRQDGAWQKFVAIPAFYGLAFWWCCQPFLYPALIGSLGASIWMVLKYVIELVFFNPFFALSITIFTTLLAAIGIFLLGPILLIIPALNGLISVQAYWLVKGIQIPDPSDSEAYQHYLASLENGSES